MQLGITVLIVVPFTHSTVMSWLLCHPLVGKGYFGLLKLQPYVISVTLVTFYLHYFVGVVHFSLLWFLSI